MVKKKSIKASSNAIEGKEYSSVLANIKKQVQEAQVKAASAANKELAILYWSIGKIIAERQEVSGWGTKVIERLAKDLQNAFPGLAGFSRINVFRMRAFYLAYKNSTTAVVLLENDKNLTAVRQIKSTTTVVPIELPIFKIPWGHNAVILEKLKNQKERLWYAQKTLEYGWSRSMLETWIKSDLYHREGKAITNFSKTLPSPQSDLAQQTLKDPYLFDFLTLQKEHLESDLEHGLIGHIQKFLIELGQGFSFLGRQYHLEIDDKDYYIDLLFYHIKLRCFVVVELKAREFDARDTGQINFYLSAIDDTLKHADDKPTIGLLLCKSKKNLTVEYALRGNSKPIGVASYETKLVESLPKNLKGRLPTIEEIEEELEKIGIEKN